MKTIGLIGGMSWESSLEYYRIMNEKVRDELGELHSAKIIFQSVDFQQIKVLQDEGKWNKLTEIMISISKNLESAGAEMIVICANTMHKMADSIQNNINIPIIHIADSTAQIIRAHKIKKVGLLGTKFTMENDFYVKRLSERHGLNVIIPAEEQRQIIHNVIFDELCRGRIEIRSKDMVLKVIDDLIDDGAEGVILGCTELPLLIKQSDVSQKLFNTTRIHAESAVLKAIQNT